MKTIKLNDTYVLTDAPRCSHRRSKNYAAIITGLDPKFGFKRTFLAKGFDNQYIFPEKPKAGDIIEVKAIYYTGSGRPEIREGSGFYKLEPDGSLTPVKESEVKKLFSHVENETF
jgi:hypothetical protein